MVVTAHWDTVNTSPGEGLLEELNSRIDHDIITSTLGTWRPIVFDILR